MIPDASGILKVRFFPVKINLPNEPKRAVDQMGCYLDNFERWSEFMNSKGFRLVEPEGPPSIAKVKAWMGAEAYGFFERITQSIEQRYPEVFIPEWLYGGKKQGWSLRYKKSKSFCTLIPEKDGLKILIVFGAEERLKVGKIRSKLSASIRKQYDAATTYHDGKWLLLTVNANRVLQDIEVLLAAKRKPKDRVMCV